MSLVSVLFLLSYSAWLVCAQSGTQCPPVFGQPGCVCQHPDGYIINLTKLASNDGKPRFTGVRDPYDYTYDFNPCYKYTDVQCTDVYICQIPNFDPTTSYEIANADEKIMIDPHGARRNVYLYYTGPGAGGDTMRYTKVYLHCDQSKTTPVITAQGDIPVALNYTFDLYSCAVCPGGCCTEENGRGGGDGGGEGAGSRGEGGGIMLLATAFVVSASTVSCIITMILLVVVIVLICRSSSSGQYI